MSSSSAPIQPGAFPETRWSVLVAARGPESREAQRALETFCSAYWYPLYGYARRCGQSPQDAEDVTQEFFCSLIEKQWLKDFEASRGKLRTFLVVAFKHFLSKEWRRRSAGKRGGGQSPVQIDTAFAESRYASDPAALQPLELFDREWALTLLDRSMARLRQEFETQGRASVFDEMKRCLMAQRGTIDYESIAQRLGIAEGAARVAVHRMRKRFRQIYREEVMQTLETAEELDSELRYLAQALTSSGQ